jgi:hypothetical protein
VKDAYYGASRVKSTTTGISLENIGMKLLLKWKAQIMS